MQRVNFPYKRKKRIVYKQKNNNKKKRGYKGKIPLTTFYNAIIKRG